MTQDLTPPQIRALVSSHRTDGGPIKLVGNVEEIKAILDDFVALILSQCLLGEPAMLKIELKSITITKDG